MRRPIILLFLILTGLAGCDQEKKRMESDLAGTYPIDTTQGDYQILKKAGLNKLNLILEKSGNYHFAPGYEFLKGYEGTWDVSNNEGDYWIFNCANGKNEQQRLLSIDLTYKGVDRTLYFGK